MTGGFERLSAARDHEPAPRHPGARRWRTGRSSASPVEVALVHERVQPATPRQCR
jgi:hypothetical protein